MNTNTNVILEWNAPSRPEHKRSLQWYIGGAVACLCMVAYGILWGSWSTALVFAFIPALYFLVRNQSHRIHHVRITDMGIEMDGTMRPWGEWLEFWILAGDGYHELHMAPIKRWTADLVVFTDPLDPYVVRDAIAQFVPQTASKKRKIT